MKTMISIKTVSQTAFLSLFVLNLLAGTLSCSQKNKFETKDPDILKQVDRQGIQKTMFRHRKYVSKCYGQALTKKGQEKLKGKITLKMSIGQDGKAQDVRYVPEDSTIKNSELSDCIAQGLTNWDFPVHPTGEVVTFKYPWVFSDAPPSNMQDKLDQFEGLKKTE